MRRHLVRKSAKAQVVHVSKDHKEPSTRHRKQDRQPHEVRGPGTRGGGWAGLGVLAQQRSRSLAQDQGCGWVGASCPGHCGGGLPVHSPITRGGGVPAIPALT